MALAVVKSWSARASGSNSLTITLTGETIAAGDLLHVATYLFANLTLAPAAPTDSAGASNTYTTRTGASWSSTFRSICGSAWSVVAVAPTTVTVNRTGATSPDIAGAVYHITGAKTSSPVNTSTANDTTSSTPTHTAMSSAQAAEIWFVDGTHDGGNITCTKPTGFTQGETNGNGSTGEPYFSGYQIFSSTQTSLAPAWSLTASANIGLTMVAYEAASGGSTDVLSFPTTGTSQVSFGTSGSDALAFPTTGKSQVAFTASGTDAIALPVTGKSTVVFTMSGTDTLSLATTGTSTVTFAISGTSSLTAVQNQDAYAIIHYYHGG